MESTQEGESLTVDQAAKAFQGILGAKEPPKTEEVKKPEVKAESIEVQTPEEDVQTEEGQDEEAKTEGTEAPVEAKTDADEAFFETLEELAEAAGIPLEKMLTLKARTKVDGIEDAVPLSQIVKSYQLESHINRKSQELAEKLKTVDQEREKFTTELNTKLQEANQLIGHFESQFMAEYNAVNWQELRQTDPAEFAAKKQEYNDRYNQLMNHRRQIQENAYNLNLEAQRKAQEKFDLLVESEREKLISRIPELRDPVKHEAAKEELSKYLIKDYGFKPEEVSQLYDHRVVDIIRKASLYDKQSTKTEIAKKKVVTLPKVLKPSAQPNQEDAKKSALAERLKRLSKTGKTEDAAEVFKLMFRKK